MHFLPLPLSFVFLLALSLPSSLAHAHPLPNGALHPPRRMHYERRGNPKYTPPPAAAPSAPSPSSSTPAAIDPVADKLASKLAAISKQLAHMPSPALSNTAAAATTTSAAPFEEEMEETKWVLAPTAGAVKAVTTTTTEAEDGEETGSVRSTRTPRRRVNPKNTAATASSTSTSAPLLRRQIPFGASSPFPSPPALSASANTRYTPKQHTPLPSLPFSYETRR